MMNDKFYFYSKSAGAKPGKGSNEILVDPKNVDKYKDLQKVKDWRKMLSNFYISPFILDDEKWNTVEHFFHAVKFRDNKTTGKNYEFYKTFTIDSGSPWSLEPIAAKQAGKAGRISKTTGKIYDKKIGNIKIPKDVSLRPDFYTGGVEHRLQSIAFLAKFTQNDVLKHMLLETKDAELWHFVGRGAPNQLWINLMKVRECIRKYDNEYDLKELSKFSEDIVTRVLV
jgi:predicted NAD-dependent protein-ADP-ribosyltransferase YbiA (DUF1768 family)